jgi:hypothetical protein
MKSYHALGLISFLVAYAVHLLISWNTETPVRLSSGGVCLDGGNMTAGARVDG